MARRKPTAAQLDALRTSLNEGRVTELPLELIEPDPGQPRRTFTDASLQDLATDIATNGVLQPITVDHTDKGWQIVMGERRWRAAMQGGLKTIPAILVPPTVPDSEDASRWQLDRRLRQFAENHHREPLPPMDLAYFLRSLRDELGLSATQIAASLKDRGVREMGRSYVSNTIRLTELPKGYQQLITDGDLAPSSGKYLLMALGLSEAGLDALDKRLEDVRQDLVEGARMTAEDVQYAVGAVFREHAYRLDVSSWQMKEIAVELADEELPYADQILFDVGQCKRCPKRQPFTTALGQQQVCCLDQAAFLEKQRAALKAIAAGEAPVPEGVEVELDLSKDEDELEAPVAGAMPPEPGYVTPEQRERELRHKVHVHLVEWLRPRIVAAFEEQPIERSIAFVLWAALRYPIVMTRLDGEPTVNKLDPWHAQFDVATPDPLHAGNVSRAELEESVRHFVPRAAGVLDMARIWRWAIALNVRLDGYNITQGYFDCCDKAEVEIIAKALGVPFTSSTTKGKLMEAIAKAHPHYVPERVIEVFGAAWTAHTEAVQAWVDAHQASEPSPAQAAA